AWNRGYARKGRRPRRVTPGRASTRGRLPGPRPVADYGSRHISAHGTCMIRIAIVDDQDLIRIGLRVRIEGGVDFVLVGEAANGREAIELIQRTRPDVVLMDIRMPVMDGIEAMQAIAEDPRLAGTRVIVLTTFDLDEYVFDALRAGASGFLIKNTEPA